MNDSIKSLADVPDSPSSMELLKGISSTLQKLNRTLCDILECLSEISEKIESEEASPWE